MNFFLDQNANFNGFKSIHLTFDIDFAPEFMIKNVINILNDFSATATFFFTHNSELGKIGGGGIEIGIHPNFDINSTQGKNKEEILDNLCKYYPYAVSNRYHKLIYQYNDMFLLSERGIKNDLSSLLYNQKYVLPSYNPNTRIMSLPYIWEDGVCENALLPMDISQIDLFSPGIKVINFHPLNIYINSKTSKERLNFLAKIKDLTNCSEKEASQYIGDGQGAYDVLIQVLTYCQDKNIKMRKVSETMKTYKKLLQKENFNDI